MRDQALEIRCPSYWMRSIKPETYPRAVGRSSVDVVIVGGGLTGLATGYHLKRAGLDVAILEARRIGAGATGASSGRFSALQEPIYADLESQRGERDARMYGEASRWAASEVPKIARDLDLDRALTRRPILLYTTDTHKIEAIDREIAASRRAGFPVERTTDSDLPFPIEAGAHLPDQPHLDPLKFCHGLATFLDGNGSAVFEGSRVIRVSEDKQPLSVHTEDRATIRAKWVVMACGLPPMDRGGYFARTLPSRSHYVALEAVGPLPESMSLSIDTPTLWAQPISRPGRAPVLFAAGVECKPGAGYDARVHYADLEAFARRHFPVDQVICRWTSQDYVPADGLAMIGRMPFGSPHVLVATGLRAGGLTIALAAARILADLVLDQPNPWAAMFDASRSRFPTSAWNLARTQTLSKVRTSRLWSQTTTPPPEALSAGAAGICRVGSESVAAFRDESGVLHSVSSTCTHRGCEVAWNPADQTWDCPCHGSRFSIDGAVLSGPAVRPLESR